MQKELEGQLFGTPLFKWQGKLLELPTRKAKALLCYLAVKQSAVPREELTELLWAKGKRKNLRQELYRLKKLPGAENWLRLENDSVLVDVRTDLDDLEKTLHQQDFQKTIKLFQAKIDKQFLVGIEPQNTPMFADWLEQKRVEINTFLTTVLQKHVKDLKDAGRLNEATEFARKLISQDPLNESFHRTIMQLEFKQGNLQAALEQYEICRYKLAKELDATPLPETIELAQEIEKAIKQPLPNPSIQTNIRVRYRIPPKLLRPPVLVGRENELAEMEKAWQAGKSIVITGSAGSGKTRLMKDFVNSKSKNIGHTYGCIGDRTVPYSSAARAFTIYQNILHSEGIESWVCYELARLSPEYFVKKPFPVIFLENRLRIFEAYSIYFTTLTQIFDVLTADDLHYYDKESFAMGTYAHSQIFANQKDFQGFRVVACYRREEIPPSYHQSIVELEKQGIFAHIDLMPLDLSSITKLLLSLEIPQSQQLVSQLYKLTGGNPQFIVEVLKSLYEQGWQGLELPKKISLSKQVSSTIEKRLGYLSQDALELVRCMAVLKEPSSIEAKHLAEIANMDYLQASKALAELEQAYIIKDGLFIHDLLLETVLNILPKPIYTALNYNIAKWLEAQNTSPTRVAHHWLQANELEQALPWQIKAAEVLLIQGEADKASKCLEEVLAITGLESELYEQARVLQNKVKDLRKQARKKSAKS